MIYKDYFSTKVVVMSHKLRSRKALNRFSEEQVAKVASHVCSASPGNILLIGGGAVLPQITGSKRLRSRSDDLDFIADDRGLEVAYPIFGMRPAKDIGMEGFHFAYVNEILVAVFNSEIKGYRIPDEAYSGALAKKTEHGTIYLAQPELNIALKIRRGSSKGKMYGKDGLDFAAICAGLESERTELDLDLLAFYMQGGVCQSCLLAEETECMKLMYLQVQKAGKTYNAECRRGAERCGKKLSETCKYHVRNID